MVQAIRSTAKFEDHSDRFLLKETDICGSCFHRQFFFIYRERNRLLKERIVDAAKKKYGIDMEPQPLINVKKKKDAFIVGIVIKRIQQRPSILKTIAAHELVLPDAVIDDNLLGNEDYLELEDDDQHIRLTGAVCMDSVATGCVAGFVGILVRADVFEVREVIWPSMALQPPFPSLKQDKYVMFLSGISIRGDESCETDNLLCLHLLQKWLGGYIPVSENEKRLVENICRLIVAGESVAITEQGKEYATMARYLVKTEECPNVKYAAIVDKLLSEITTLLEVDLMPGAGDPATHLIPQQPIHRAVFPKASLYGEMLRLVTNPYYCSIDGVRIMGTSGQNVNDLKRFCEESSSVKLLRNLMRWQHIAPTVPDTIDGFPFEHRDPLIIEDTLPHIFFAGNQTEADYCIEQFNGGRKVLLLSVPRFSITKSALLVNLRTLEVIEQSFTFDDAN